MMNPIKALRGFLKRLEQSAPRRANRDTRLLVESLEGRRLLTTSNALPAIQGTVFSDLNNNDAVDIGEAIQNAQLVLWMDDGDGNFNSTLDTQVGTAITTDANGEYCFDDIDPDTAFFVEQIAQTVGGVNLPQVVSDLIETEPQLIIDTFVTSQSTIALPPPVSSDESSLTLAAAEAIGGERDLAVELSGGTSEVQLRVNPFGLDDVLLFDSSAGTVGIREVTWDGIDGDGDDLAMALGGLDLTQNGALGGFTMRIGVDANGANARLRLYQGSDANFSEATVAIPVTGGAATEFVFIPFSSFAGPSLETNVDAIQLFIDTGNRSVDGQIDTIGVLGASTANFANVVQVDVELDKTVDSTIVDNGDTVTWTITVTNNQDNANSAATDVVVTDLLPSGVTFVSANPTNGTFTGGTWTLADPLQPGDSETLVLVTTVDEGISGGSELTNTAEVTNQQEADVDSTPANDDGDQSEDDEDNASVTLRELVDLEVTKVSNTAVAQIGEEVTFTVTITNNDDNANTSATGVQVTDALPAGMTLVSATPSGNGTFNGGIWSLVDPLTPGGSQTLQIVASVDSGVAGESQLQNVAQVTAVNEEDIDSGPANDDGDQSEDDEDNAAFTVGSVIDLELDKTANVTAVNAGDTIVWTVNVTNNQDNANTAATNVEVTDLIPSGATFVSAVPSGNGTFNNGTWALVDPLQPGSVASLSLTTTANAGEGGTSIINAAEVSLADQTDIDSTPGNDDGDRSEDDEDEAIVVRNSIIDLELSKSVNQSTVLVGTDVIWTVSITNNQATANASATGVTVTDVLPAGLSLVNAVVTSGTVVGDVWTLGGPLAPGDVESLTLTTTVDADAPNSIQNVAEVGAANEADVDSIPGNDDGDQSEDDEDNAQINVTPLAIDLELAKSADVTVAIPGDQVTWTVSITNNAANANTAATGVQVADVIPAGVSLQNASATNGSFAGGTWTLASALAPGDNATLTLITTVDSDAPSSIANVAQVSAANEADVDSAPANDNGDQSEDDEDNALITVSPLAIDLELTKEVSASQVIAGDQVTWTLSLTNNADNANTAATGVQVGDVLPNGVTLQTATPSDGTFAGGTWTLGSDLAPGASQTLTLVTTVDSDAPSTINNVAEVSAANETDVDSQPGNDDGDQSQDDEDGAQLTVSPEAIDLELSKSVSATQANVGDQVTWSITVTNNAANANTAATGVEITDVLPNGVTFQSASPTTGTFNNNAWTLVDALAPGQSETLSIVTQINTNAAGGDVLTNVAEVSAANQTDIDSVPGNDDGDQSEDDEANAQVTVAEVVDLQLEKTADTFNVSVGDAVTWTITVSNNAAVANTAATGVVVADQLPGGLDFVSANASNGSYNSGTGIWTLAAPLNPGDTATLTIVSNVNADASRFNVQNVAQITAQDQGDVDSAPGNDDGNQSEDDEAQAQINVAAPRPALSKRALLASTS